ncbi:MAG: hypothetical protein V1746_00720 [bacterium]
MTKLICGYLLPVVMRIQGEHIHAANKRRFATEKAKRRKAAWQMRLAGAPVRRIAERLGVSEKSVACYIREELDGAIERTRHSLTQYRQLELERLEGLLTRWYPVAVAGSFFADDDEKNVEEDDLDVGVKAAALTLKIIERLAKLLGLDALETPETGGGETPLEQWSLRTEVKSPLLLAACEAEKEGNEKQHYATETGIFDSQQPGDSL